ncbi:MAG: hypothetical protein LUG95_01115 [Clostridiales bacterium]|nr:hypothetical protein [Clostridiales bacterium]
MKRISSIKRLTVLFVLLLVLCLLFARTTVLPSANISSVGNGKKIVLTFYDGPGDFTGKLLDGLENTMQRQASSSSAKK